MTNKMLCMLRFPLAYVALLYGAMVVAEEGWYAGMELGLAVSPETTITGGDNDWSTACDLIINPQGLETTPTQCATAPPRSSYHVGFGSAAGPLAAVTFGYEAARWRVEGEYLFRIAVFDDVAPTGVTDATTLEKVNQELETQEGTLDDVISHGLFANLHYRFGGQRWQPYVGVGLGFSRAFVDHATYWQRNDNPEYITTFEDPALRAKVAGTITIGDARHSDTVLGYQLIVGVDRPLNESTTLSAKFRWVRFDDFEGKDIEWDQLRSHESTVGRGGPVLYRIATEDLGFWAVGAGLRYRF